MPIRFLTEQLRPELLQSACEKANIPLTLRRQPGYDHSYYFISTFMSDHLRWHAARLRGDFEAPARRRGDALHRSRS